MYFTNYIENKILNTFLGVSFVGVSSTYLELLTSRLTMVLEQHL